MGLNFTWALLFNLIELNRYGIKKERWHSQWCTLNLKPLKKKKKTRLSIYWRMSRAERTDIQGDSNVSARSLMFQPSLCQTPWEKETSSYGRAGILWWINLVSSVEWTDFISRVNVSIYSVIPCRLGKNQSSKIKEQNLSTGI